MPVTRTVTLVQAITPAAPAVGPVAVTLTVDDVMAFGNEVVNMTGPQSVGSITLTRTQLTDLNNLITTLVLEARQAIVPG